MTFEKPNDKRTDIDRSIEHLRKLSEMEPGFINKEIEYLKQFMPEDLPVSDIQDLLDTYDIVEEYRSQNSTQDVKEDIEDELCEPSSPSEREQTTVEDREIASGKSSVNIPIEVKDKFIDINKVSKNNPSVVKDKEFKFHISSI